MNSVEAENAEKNTAETLNNRQDEASIQDVLPSLEQLFNVWQQRWQEAKALISADIQLSVKAIVLCIMTVMLMIAVSTVLWIAVNLTLVAGLHSVHLHWLTIALIILLLNSGLLYWLSVLFKGAFRAISLNQSFSALMAKPLTKTDVNQSTELNK